MKKFKNKYRIESVRLQNWDYSSNGAYFITICTQNRECFFGKIVDNEMQLNAFGLNAEKYWMEIPNHFLFIELGGFVIMPNHMHGILMIDNHRPSPITEINGGFTGIKNPMFHENISRIIRWYKGRCSFEIRKTNADFAWQPRFYEHIIRDTQSFERIQNYIFNNPSKWNGS
jgi:REP element-mobilizing transposase RayT